MPEYTGGVAAITSDQYKAINGFSNLYLGWGCEDEDFYVRIIDRGLSLVRVDPMVSIHHSLSPHMCLGHHNSHCRSVATGPCLTCQTIQIGFGTKPFLNWTEKDFPTLSTLLTKTDLTRTDMITINIYRRGHNTGPHQLIHCSLLAWISWFAGLILMDSIMPRNSTL